MKVLFDHYTDSGNIGGAATDVYQDILKANTLLMTGDKLVGEYILNSSISDLSIDLRILAKDIAIPNVVSGDNLIKFVLYKILANKFRYFVTSTNSSSTHVISGDYSPDTFQFQTDGVIKLTIQDTSGSPVDNSILAKAGTILFIPAS